MRGADKAMEGGRGLAAKYPELIYADDNLPKSKAINLR